MNIELIFERVEVRVIHYIFSATLNRYQLCLPLLTDGSISLLLMMMKGGEEDFHFHKDVYIVIPRDCLIKAQLVASGLVAECK